MGASYLLYYYNLMRGRYNQKKREPLCVTEKMAGTQSTWEGNSLTCGPTDGGTIILYKNGHFSIIFGHLPYWYQQRTVMPAWDCSQGVWPDQNNSPSKT